MRVLLPGLQRSVNKPSLKASASKSVLHFAETSLETTSGTEGVEVPSCRWLSTCLTREIERPLSRPETKGAIMNWPIGASSIFVRRVVDKYLASSWGNTGVDVLATPILLWLGELACMKVVEDYLPPGMMTIASGHNSTHLAVTPANFTVEVTATLLDVKGATLLFSLEATDGSDPILAGEHTRMIVDAGTLRQDLRDKAAASSRRFKAYNKRLS